MSSEKVREPTNQRTLRLKSSYFKSEENGQEDKAFVVFDTWNHIRVDDDHVSAFVLEGCTSDFRNLAKQILAETDSLDDDA